ncbi:MAG: hydantoinase B/oxoprolinase family protein [Alphaproteobacteria bacterium]
MPATIIETNQTPFETVQVDPVDLDIIENSLRSARFEMDAVLFRTAMSPGIREQHDEFPLIANRDGKMVVGQYGAFIHTFLQVYEGEIEEGDIFLTNDPYSCDGAISHTPDWLVLLPIFKEGRVIGWASMFGHMTDNGGRVPGSIPTDAQQIFEEGIIIPPLKLYQKGVLQNDILSLILHNCRMPEWNRSDLHSLIAGCRLAASRVTELSSRFGDDVYHSALNELLERTRRAVRDLIIANVPEEKQYFEDWVCDDGLGMGPYRIACSMWREGEKLMMDFSGTDPQSAGHINFYCNEEMTKMYCGVFMIYLADPQILFNDGFYDVMDIKIPKGSLLLPQKPAALSGRTHALARVCDVLNGLFGQGNPDYLCAAGFSASPHFFFSGHNEYGEWFQQYQIGFGGIAGKPSGDGADGHAMFPDFMNVPNEFVEAMYPLRIEIYQAIPDTGGAGLHRGGNGIHTGYRFLREGQVSIHDDRWLTHPWGVKGGLPGARSSKILERAGGSRTVLPAKCDRIKVAPGDILHFRTWGGGGWGDPFARPAEKVLAEVEGGLATVEGARRYGVVIIEADGEFSVDAAATETLREVMRAARGNDIPLFDKGGTLSELIARCEEDTGLPPPAPPVFPAWVQKDQAAE